MEDREEGRKGRTTERGKEGRKKGNRAKPGNQLVCSLVRPTLDYASAGYDLYTQHKLSH